MDEEALSTWIQAKVDEFIADTQEPARQPYTKQTDADLLFGAAVVFSGLCDNSGLFGAFQNCLNEEDTLVPDALIAFEVLGNSEAVELIVRGRTAYEEIQQEQLKYESSESVLPEELEQSIEDQYDKFDEELYGLEITEWLETKALEIAASENP